MHSVYFDEEKANKLDQTITEGMLAVEKECNHMHRLPWNKIMHFTMTKLNILRCMMSVYKNGIDNEEVMAAKIKALNDPGFEKPPNYDTLIKEHRETRKAARETAKNARSHSTTARQEREKAFIEAHEEIMSAKQATSLFRRKENVTKLMKSLPKSGRKKIASGPLSCVLVPLPKEGKGIEWYAITDGPTIEIIILEKIEDTSVTQVRHPLQQTKLQSYLDLEAIPNLQKVYLMEPQT